MPRQAPYTGTISLNEPQPVRYGDRISFHVTTNAPYSYVRGTFSQDGVPVAYGGQTIYREADYDTHGEFGLYAPSWPSGGAHAHIELQSVKSSKTGRTRYTTLATIDFEVAA